MRRSAANAGRVVIAAGLAVALGLVVAEPAGAGQSTVQQAPSAMSAPSPTPPPNPSDDDINSSQQQAQDAAAQVGELSGQVSATESKISQLQADMELKSELANKALVDLDLANDDAAKAKTAAQTAAAEADAAGKDITTAEQQAAEFAAASFRNGSTLGSAVALLGADSATDLLQQDALLQQVSESQLDVIGRLESARNAKANKDAAARAAQNTAEAKAKDAQTAAKTAEVAKADAITALNNGDTELKSLQDQLATQQQAYLDALNNTESLKAQREAYNQWLAEKKAEEERQRKAAEERARQARIEQAKEEAAAKAAAEAKAAADKKAADERQAQLQAAKQAAAEKKAAQDAALAKKAAAEKKAAADKAAKQAADAKQADQAAKAAEAKKTADAAAAAKRDADAKAAAAEKAAQEKAAADKAAADKKTAAEQAGAQQTAAEKEAAAALAAKKKQDELRAQATRAAQLDAARKAKAQADKLKAIRGQGTGDGAYFQNCDAARAAGFAPMKKGEPGYRAALDPNGNGVACDAGTSSDPSAGAGGGGGTGAVNVPTDSSKGSIVVRAALKWLGTPYSWGGGNASGPTTGIRAGCSSTCMRYEPWNTVGFDCSGLALYAWAQVGVSLPHYSAYQYNSGQHISRENLQPGDLVFFANNTSDPATIHHVAIYIGNNQLVEAPQSGVPVRIRGWRTDGYIGATRPGT